jgi:hypothetical protein
MHAFPMLGENCVSGEALKACFFEPFGWQFRGSFGDDQPGNLIPSEFV